MTDVVGTLTIEMAANVARLTEDFAEAKRVVQESVSLIQLGVNEMSDGIKRNMKEVSESIKGVQESFKLIAEAAVLGYSAESIVEGTKHVAEYADEVEKSSQKTGIAAETLQELQFAAKMSDISSQELDKSLKKLAQAMEGASNGGTKATEAFAAVGLKASDLKNMKTEDVLAKIADAFAESNDGAGKAAIAVELFGKSGTDMIPFLNKGSASIGELMAKAKELGLVMGGETLEAAAQLHEQFQLMDAQIEGMHRRMSMQLAPAFLQITAAFNESSQNGGALEGIFKGLNSVLLEATKLASYVAQAFNAMGITIGAAAAAIVTAAHGDFTAASKIMDEGQKDIEASTKKFEDFRATLEKPVALKKPVQEEDAPKKDLHLRGKDKKEASKMPQYEEELAAMKLAAAGEEQTREQQKESEIAYWVTIRDAATTSAADRLAIQKKVAAEVLSDLELMKKAREAAQKAQSEGDAKVAEAQYAITSAAIKAAEQAGQITKTQAIAAEEAVQDAILQIKINGIQAQMDAIHDKTTAEYIKLNAELSTIEAKRQADEIKSQGDIAAANAAAAQKSLDAWQKALQPISTGFDKMITGMIQGTTTWQKSWGSILKSIEAEFVNSAVKMATDWAAKELWKTTATAQQIAAREALEQTASATSLATTAGTLLKEIAGYAATAFAGVTAFLAPLLGPAAPAAAATVSALVLAEGAHVMSAAGGYDIPAGVNPLTQLHQNEMVLPANLADNVRNMSAGGNQPMTVHIHAMDALSIKSFLDRNGSYLVDSLNRQARSFNYGKTK